ncbi:chemotaxis protein CheY [Sorangium cellulosum]|uniref:Chemotaxis protein CheY n=1 Tax=Sorangium cellulosum TaxID=56 RepID=A0A2L0EN17_SORCE|nr:chemotaxis protein CheY [Sorangium cellulosum]
MRAYVRSTLEDCVLGLAGDVDIVEAMSGFDALRLLPRGAFDLVITDINMPDINGLELIRFVRQSDRYRRVGILIISTQATERDIQRGLKLGADGFLAKPFTPEALHDAVVACLDGRAQRAEAGDALPDAAGDGGAPPPAGALDAPPPAVAPDAAPARKPRHPGSHEGGGG